MTTKEKIYDIVLTIFIWTSLWFILEYFFVEGDIEETTLCLYIGACIGYIMGQFGKKFKLKKDN
jgi:hypothetical protein